MALDDPYQDKREHYLADDQCHYTERLYNSIFPQVHQLVLGKERSSQEL